MGTFVSVNKSLNIRTTQTICCGRIKNAQKQLDVCFWWYFYATANFTLKLMHLRGPVELQNNVLLSSYLLELPGRDCSRPRTPPRWWSSLSPRSRCSNWDPPLPGETPRHLSVLIHQRWHLMKKKAGRDKGELLLNIREHLECKIKDWERVMVPQDWSVIFDEISSHPAAVPDVPLYLNSFKPFHNSK